VIITQAVVLNLIDIVLIIGIKNPHNIQSTYFKPYKICLKFESVIELYQIRYSINSEYINHFSQLAESVVITVNLPEKIRNNILKVEC
jgi:hypothetical protein